MNSYISKINPNLFDEKQLQELSTFLDICKIEFEGDDSYDLNMIYNICVNNYYENKDFNIEYFVWSMKLNCKIY